MNTPNMTTPAQHTAHTPGPWTAESAVNFSPGRHDDERWTVHLNGLPVIAVVEQYRGEAEANARLIAAAPILYEACKAVCAALGDISNSQHERGLPTEDVNKISRAFFQAQRAIARAEQSSPREGKI